MYSNRNRSRKNLLFQNCSIVFVSLPELQPRFALSTSARDEVKIPNKKNAHDTTNSFMLSFSKESVKQCKFIFSAKWKPCSVGSYRYKSCRLRNERRVPSIYDKKRETHQMIQKFNLILSSLIISVQKSLSESGSSYWTALDRKDPSHWHCKN